MIHTFAHAGHDHKADESFEASNAAYTNITQSHTEHNVAVASTDHTLVIVGGVTLALVGAMIIAIAFILGNKRATKKK